ncbi:MAG: helix-turn-helix transcriptional regulator [Candidatus Krumholzibacteriota bacterium]|nr:helix-turn-helix transcriptional regulator [Candidatus Krumholzibacteriota bacterium]
MAEPSRLSIMQKLCDREMNVTELVDSTGFSQANVSKHLRILRTEELVDYRRENKKIYYSLKNDMPREVCNIICRSLEDELSSEAKILKKYWRS